MFTLIIEGNHESKNTKDINKNVVDGKLKYGDYKKVSFDRSYMRHEGKIIQGKDHNVKSY